MCGACASARAAFLAMFCFADASFDQPAAPSLLPGADCHAPFPVGHYAIRLGPFPPHPFPSEGRGRPSEITARHRWRPPGSFSITIGYCKPQCRGLAGGIFARRSHRNQFATPSSGRSRKLLAKKKGAKRLFRSAPIAGLFFLKKEPDCPAVSVPAFVDGSFPAGKANSGLLSGQRPESGGVGARKWLTKSAMSDAVNGE